MDAVVIGDKQKEKKEYKERFFWFLLSFAFKASFILI